jgi:hypothetical protein
MMTLIAAGPQHYADCHLIPTGTQATVAWVKAGTVATAP